MSDKVKSLYVASPFGFSEAGRLFMYEKLIPEIEKAGFAVIDPWKLTSRRSIDLATKLPDGPKKIEAWRRLNRIIGMNNESGIRLSDGLVAVLDGTDVDSGTASEIGFAHGIDKKIVGYKGDFRLAGDNVGSIVNLQPEYFILNNGGVIVTALKDLEPALKSVFG